MEKYGEVAETKLIFENDGDNLFYGLSDNTLYALYSKAEDSMNSINGI